MRSPFEILGLADDADAPQIKRAYARMLRSHRPDEDATAFQQLHEAYQACLQHASWQRMDASHAPVTGEEAGTDPEQWPDDTGETPVFVVSHAPVQEDFVGNGRDPVTGNERIFDCNAFINELTARMQQGTGPAFSDWLQGHEDLYSLDLKRALRPAVVDAIGSLPVGHGSTSEEAIGQTIAFFGLDSVSREDDWLHQRLHAIWQRRHDVERFDGHLNRYTSRHANWTDRLIARELIEPIDFSRRLFLGLVPGLPSRVAALAGELHERDPESASTRLEQGSARFWTQAMDRSHVRRPRLVVASTRCLLWTLLPSIYAAPYLNEHGWWLNWFFVACGLGVAWLLYAIVTIGFIHLQRYNQKHLQWDPVTLGLAIRAVISTALMLWSPLAGLVSFGIAGILWVGSRGSEYGTTSANQWATIATALSALSLAMLLSPEVTDTPLRMRHAFIGAALYALTVLALHDIAWARHKRIPLARAHLATGWLWWVFVAHLLACIAAMTLLDM